MGNLERPLTWGLAIVLMGYLFIANSHQNQNLYNRCFMQYEQQFSIILKYLQHTIRVLLLWDLIYTNDVNGNPNE